MSLGAQITKKKYMFCLQHELASKIGYDSHNIFFTPAFSNLCPLEEANL
jgi:hypothetical protein